MEEIIEFVVSQFADIAEEPGENAKAVVVGFHFRRIVAFFDCLEVIDVTVGGQGTCDVRCLFGNTKWRCVEAEVPNGQGKDQEGDAAVIEASERATAQVGFALCHGRFEWKGRTYWAYLLELYSIFSELPSET